jgi:hypothetical protein
MSSAIVRGLIGIGVSRDAALDINLELVRKLVRQLVTENQRYFYC